MNKLFVMTFAMAFILCSGIALGAVTNEQISVQGKLTGADGAPLDGSYTVKFELYSTATGGTSPVWQETQSLTINNGLFHALLGETN